jgi:[ribosomal protein S5]-alanine N-acetyltransferase
MIPAIPTEYTSERLLLRRYRPEDAPAYFRMLGENQVHLREFMPAILVNVQNADDVRAVIDWQIEEWQRGELFIMGLWEKSRGEYVGEVYLANADWDVPCIEVGYFTVKQQGGKGYASEACRVACRIAFERLGVRRVELQCAADNEKSARVAQRCGFTLEGRLRERSHKKDGSLVDRLWFGLLQSEWQDSLSK